MSAAPKFAQKEPLPAREGAHQAQAGSEGPRSNDMLNDNLFQRSETGAPTAGGMLAAALEYAACGIPVFPCIPGGKAPLPDVDFEDATTARGRIEDWWSEYPDANIGACPADFDAVVLDARDVVDQDLLARLRGEDTLVHRTPHHGEHFFFYTPDRFGNGPFASGINAHCTTGHILLPPSVVDGRPYQVLRNCGRITSFPGWAMERLAGAGARGATFTTDSAGRDGPNSRRRDRRYGGWTATEGAALPPLTYWDAEQLLPCIPGEGCTGYLIGDTGSHKSGTAIMLALNAIAERRARVLYIATEGALGIAKYRLPKACRAHGMTLEELDPYWRVESEDIDICDPQDRAALLADYRDFAPGLIFIDVMTLAVGGADINSTKDAVALRQAAKALAKGFGGATILFVHHPSRKGMSADGSGSNMFRNLAYFQLDAYYEKGVVRIFVKKMKDGEAGRAVYFKNAAYDTKNPLDGGVPVIRRMTEEELQRHQRTRERPNLAAETARDDAAVSRLSSDVQRYLRESKSPTLVRDFAKLMMERDEHYLKQTEARLSDRDLQTLTPDEIRERCLATLCKRLQRGIGDDRHPGELYPFIGKVAGGKLPPKDRRFLPLPT
jgi:Bifunctional DNA primase/polymerase, N-terminal/AAA domain